MTDFVKKVKVTELENKNPYDSNLTPKNSINS